MIVDGSKQKLNANLVRQLSSYWEEFDEKVIAKGIDLALCRMESLLSYRNKTDNYVWKGDEIYFSPYHSVEYSIFLYFLSNCLYKNKLGFREAEIIYYLNKIMHSCDWFYAVELPDVFWAEHPLGSILGRAVYGSHFSFYQGVTVGGNYDSMKILHYPQIGNNVRMYANSKVIGSSKIGNNVILSADCTLMNEIIPDNCIVFGKSPNIVIKKKSFAQIRDMQTDIWEELYID